MNARTCSRLAALVLVIFVLVSAQIACSTGKTGQLASAVPPSAEPGQEGEVQPSEESPQESQPTKAPASTKTPKPAEPTLTPTPKPEPVIVIDQGYGQEKQQFSFAFVLENPNQAIALEYTEFQVAAYDASDVVINTESGSLGLLLPGQRFGVSGMMWLNEGVTVAKIDIQVKTGDPTLTDLTEPLSTSKVTYRPTDYISFVSGLISNPYDYNLKSIRVNAVLYDAADKIIGGGLTYHNFILAHSASGVVLVVSSAGEVARAELYAMPAGISLLGDDGPPPEGSQPVVVLNQGFGQNRGQIGLGMLIQNPNSSFSIESSMYNITIFGEDGSVLAVEEGTINTLLPNQMMGIGGQNYLGDDMVVGSVEFQLLTGQYVQAEPVPVFTAENVNYVPGDYSQKVTGVIVSPYNKDVSNVRVNAIAYNDAGEIIGGGYAYLEFIPANGKAAIDVNIAVAGVPAKVELYATVSALSDIE
jgi:hypothetical protein